MEYPKKYEVRINNDGYGYYVVTVIGGMDLYVKGVSLNKQEMIDLANKLNEDEHMLTVEEAYQKSKT
jgi:hypothetical protein